MYLLLLAFRFPALINCLIEEQIYNTHDWIYHI